VLDGADNPVQIYCSEAFRKHWFDFARIPGLGDEQAEWYAALNERELIAYVTSWRRPWRKKVRSRLFTGSGHVKKLVRVRVYEHAHKLLGQHRYLAEQRRTDRADRQEQDFKNRVLILPGGEPEHEAGLARQLFKDAEIVAFDVDDRAVQAAAPFVDLAVPFNVADLRFGGQQRSPRCLTDRYKFANLDFCGLVTSKDTGLAIDRIQRMTPLVATWFSFGHEQNLSDMQAVAKRVGARSEDHLSSLPETIRTRMLYIWDVVRFSDLSFTPGHRLDTLRALKVWSYRDQRMPMMCVLWDTSGTFFDYGSHERKDVLEYEKVIIDETAFRAVVLDTAARQGTQFTCTRFGIRPAVLAAWRAVVTRQARAAGREAVDRAALRGPANEPGPR
jgi:hypothetical protein